VCSARIRWSRRIAHFQGLHLPEVSIRIVGRFNHAVSILLIGAAVRSCLIVNPILFRVGHATTSGNLSCRPRAVERTRTRTVTECLGSVAALTRIPLVNNHLHRHLASPYAVRAFSLVCSRRKSPMTAFAVDRKRRWDTAPRGRLRLVLDFVYGDFQIAHLVKFNGLQTRVCNRQCISGYQITGSEIVFGVSAFPYANEKLSGLTCDPAAYPERITQIHVTALIE
jgi:hypothetical protein